MEVQQLHSLNMTARRCVFSVYLWWKLCILVRSPGSQKINQQPWHALILRATSISLNQWEAVVSAHVDSSGQAPRTWVRFPGTL